METEIRRTDAPPRELLLLGDESPESLHSYLGRSTCYAARCGERIVGVCLLIATHPFTAEIVNLAVDPGFQRRGIGSALIAHAMREARGQGFRRLEIATGYDEKGPLKLYRSLGFEPVEIERDYFPKYYGTPVAEAGGECRDLIRLRTEL